ncbi:MAG: molybdopterin-dependent oxidoreductase, partial [Anaerolineae bacterium]|nr:molybdopterin-dependent oxidoreductase [Anaerolineae bacterium]
MSEDLNLNRRDFLKLSTAAGGGLLISIYLNGCRSDQTATPTISATSTDEPQAPPLPTFEFQPGAYLKIDSNGVVTITVHKPEVGQGVRTALPMIIAEELGADWHAVRVEQAPANPTYGNQVTGGSLSVSDSYGILRSAGAMARTMLVAAAADIWGIPRDACTVENGEVINNAGAQRISFGDLVETAAGMDPIYGFELKDERDFSLIGTRVPRVDNPALVSGAAAFGTDVVLPGMLYAVLARSPYIGGELRSYDSSQAENMPGVRQVVEIENGIAVVAENTWQALQGREALQLTWSRGPQNISSSNDANVGMVTLNGRMEGTYSIPHFAHAPMEPMNCTADVRADSCEVWAPTQDPADAKNTARRITGLLPDAVTVHVPFIGGGFGRRLDVDYVAEAVRISQAIDAPVKLLWTREDDIRHDHFHPRTTVKVNASLDSPGMPRVLTNELRSPVPTGAWRSVTNFDQAFGRECFMDEYAEALGEDPLALRLDLDLHPRLKEVLIMAAEKAGWGTPAPAGMSRGIACFSTWDATHVAEVAEVSISPGGAIRVHRIV